MLLYIYVCEAGVGVVLVVWKAATVGLKDGAVLIVSSLAFVLFFSATSLMLSRKKPWSTPANGCDSTTFVS